MGFFNKKNEKTNDKANDNSKNTPFGEDNPLKYLLVSVLVGLVVMFSFSMCADYIRSSSEPEYERTSYAKFEKLLTEHKIDTVYFDETAMNMKYTVLTEKTKNLTVEERNDIPITEKTIYETSYPFNTDGFSEKCLLNGAEFSPKPPYALVLYTPILRSLTVKLILPFLSLILVMLCVTNLPMFPWSQDDDIEPETSGDVKLSDVIGQDEVIKDLKLQMDIFQHPDKYKDLDLHPSHGVLLYGPPGTGKTMIAKALANECGLKFFYANSSSFVDRFVGMGARNVRKFFDIARENAPCILFFDEIDAIGVTRDSSGGQNSEYVQTVNALLQELDGFREQDKVFVLAATNRADGIDPALLRSGRFDKKISINPPSNAETREKLFKLYLKDSADKSVDIHNLSLQSAGITGADIAEIVNDAKLIAASKEHEKLSNIDLEEALDRFYMKGNRTKTTHNEDMNIISFHECGHALSMLLSGLPVARISIIPNTSGIGGMVVRADSNKLFITKEEMEKEIISLYAGRAAEEIVFGNNKITNGASNDISEAKKMIRQYVESYGFDQETGYGAVYDENRHIKERIQSLADMFYQKAKAQIEEHKDILFKMQEEVIKQETMTGPELTELYQKLKGEEL